LLFASPKTCQVQNPTTQAESATYTWHKLSLHSLQLKRKQNRSKTASPAQAGLFPLTKVCLEVQRQAFSFEDFRTSSPQGGTTMPDQIIETPKRFQCRHIFTDGHRCGSPCLRGEAFCYYHHTTRRPIQNPEHRRARTSTFHLSLPEDRSAIQSSIGEILQRIAANEIDPKRAGLLLYGLQIASLNLPKEKEPRPQPNLVEEIETNPELGTLAPQTEFLEESQKPTTLTLLLESLRQPQLNPEEQTQIPESNQPNPNPNPQPTTLPTLQATAAKIHIPNPKTGIPAWYPNNCHAYEKRTSSPPHSAHRHQAAQRRRPRRRHAVDGLQLP
jgi:hypothetical protein